MVYESVVNGLSKVSLDRYKVVLFTSDGKREIYKDFDRILGLLSGTEYFYVVVFRNDKFHIHMIIRDSPFYKHQLKKIWTIIHGCPKFGFESVKDVDAMAFYLATQKSIDFVDMSGGWLNE